jgi:hypothetical protein
MIFEVEEAQKLCDWMLDRGLGLGECAYMLSHMECGDTFALALFKVFKNRELKTERLHERFNARDWGNPITG